MKREGRPLAGRPRALHPGLRPDLAHVGGGKRRRLALPSAVATKRQEAGTLSARMIITRNAEAWEEIARPARA